MRKIYIPPYLNPKRNYFARFICAPGCIFLSLYFIVGGLYELYGYEVRRVEQCAVVVHPPQPKHKLSVNFHCSDDKSKFMYTFYPVDGGEVLAALNEKRVDFEFHAIPYFKNDQNVAHMWPYQGMNRLMTVCKISFWGLTFALSLHTCCAASLSPLIHKASPRWAAISGSGLAR